MSSVAIQNRGISVGDLSRMVHDDDLSSEVLSSLGWVVLGVTANVSTTDILDGNVTDVESDVVTGQSLGQLLVMHFDGLDVSGNSGGSEGDVHVGLQDTGLDTANRDGSNTRNLVDVLERDTQGLVSGSGGRGQVVESANQSGSLVPGHLVRGVEQVVSVESSDGDEGDLLSVADLLQVVSNVLLDLLITLLRVVVGVHLVQGNNELLDTESVGEQSVLTSLAVTGKATLESSGRRIDDENGSISLRGTGNHVLDEISVAGGINDGVLVLGRLELPEGDINGNTTLTLSLQFVQNPGILEGALSDFGGFLLELFDDTLVDSSERVNEMASGGGLTGIDVTNDDEREMSLFLSLFL